MNADVLIPILVPLGFFAMIFGIVYMHKKENLAMVDKNMNPKLQYRAPQYLKWGLLLVGAGSGLFIGYIFDEYLARNSDNEALYFAMIAIGGGVGLICSYKMDLKEYKQSNPTLPQVPSEL